MKKNIKWLVIIFFIVLCAVFMLNKLRGHGYFSAVKNYIAYCLDKPDFTKLSPLEDDNNAWYQNNEIIAHAMGGIGETDYTNSKEAFEEAYQNGFKIFETDFSVTKDGKTVCAHDFEQFGKDTIPNYTEFMNSSIKERLTPMDIRDVVELLEKHPDIYLMTDFKWDNSFGSDNSDVDTILSELTELIDGREELENRIIIQIYGKENYEHIKETYPFSNYVFTLYLYAYPIYEDIAAFCLENDIPVVTMGKERATQEHVSVFEKWNIKVFTHTVNTQEEVKEQKNNGVSGFYTDWLLPQGVRE